MTATLLMDVWLRTHPQSRVTGFSFRAKRPLFDGAPIHLFVDEHEGGANLRAVDAFGQTAVEAEVKAQS